MSKVIAILAGSFIVFGMQSAQAHPHQRTDRPCESQINAYLANAGTSASSIFWQSDDTETDNGNVTAWVKTPSCNGHYVFKFWVSKLVCENVHYGDVPNYVQEVYRTGGCR